MAVVVFCRSHLETSLGSAGLWVCEWRGVGWGSGAHPDPLSPSRLQGGHGGAQGRQAFWEGAWRVGYGGTEGAGPWTAGELADPASLWATRAGEAGYQDVMGGRAGCGGLFPRGSSLRGPCWCKLLLLRACSLPGVSPVTQWSTFTFIKRLLSSSSLYAIRVVSSAYLRLLIFLPAILIPVCVSSSPVFRGPWTPWHHPVNPRPRRLLWKHTCKHYVATCCEALEYTGLT